MSASLAAGMTGTIMLLTAGCSGTVDSMMGTLCGVQLEPWNGDTGANADSCEPMKGVQNVAGDPCHHRGGFWKHDWFADNYGNEFFPDSGPHMRGGSDDYGFGCDADLQGVSYDGIKQAKRILFEVKTADYTVQLGVCNGFVADRQWDNVTNSVQKEEPVAARCNYSYELVLCDQNLANKATAYYQPPHTVNVVHDGSCVDAPDQPTDYKAQALPASSDDTLSSQAITERNDAMSYDLFLVPVTRPVQNEKDFDQPGVVRTITIDEAREALLPALPAGYPWKKGDDWVNWRAPDGSRLEVSCASDGKCVYLRTSGGFWGEAAEAVKRIAQLSGWSIYDGQVSKFVRWPPPVQTPVADEKKNSTP